MYKLSWIVLVGCVTVSVLGYTIFTGEAGTECEYFPGGAVVQPGSGCRQFLLCDLGGLAFGPQDCAHGTLFHEANKTCIWEDEVNCSEAPGDTLAPDCVTEAVPGDCQRYRQCVMGVQYHRACSNLTLYSSSLHVCVYLDDLKDWEREICGF